MTAASGQALEWGGPRVRLARAAWFSIATLSLITVLASIPAYIGSAGILTETEHAAGVLMGSPTLFSPSPEFEFWADVAFDLLSFGTAALSLTLAAVIFVRRPKEPVAFAVSLILLLYGVVMAGPLEILAGQSVAGEALVQFVAMPLWALVLVLFYIFPDGRFIPRWTRWFSLFLIPWSIGMAFWPVQMSTTATVSFTVFLVLYTLPSLTGPFAQIYRYRRVSGPVERQQTKWVILGFTAFTLGGTVVTGVLWLGWTLFLVPTIPAPTVLSSGIVIAGRMLWPLSLTFVPLTLTVAVLRYRLWDIDFVIRRTLTYGALTALMALVYIGAVVSLQSLFTALGGQQRSELVTVISTLTIAALFVPLRNRVQTFIDRRFYRSKYDAAHVLAQFGASVRQDVDLDELTNGLLAAVDRSMQPAHAGLWLTRAAALSTGNIDDHQPFRATQ
jgi:hypothetical protein